MFFFSDCHGAKKAKVVDNCGDFESCNIFGHLGAVLIALPIVVSMQWEKGVPTK